MGTDKEKFKGSKRVKRFKAPRKRVRLSATQDRRMRLLASAIEEVMGLGPDETKALAERLIKRPTNCLKRSARRLLKRAEALAAADAGGINETT